MLMPFSNNTKVYQGDVNSITIKAATAISMENSERGPDKAIDGETSTMWIAADGNPNNWWEADLGENYDMTGIRITFENDINIWKYKIEVSKDDINWTMAADKTQNTVTDQIQESAYNLTGRYVRVTVTETPGSLWTAFSEFNVFGTKSSIPTIPSVPTGLNAVVLSDSEISVSWNSSEGAAGYDIEADGAVINNVTSPYVQTGLNAGSSHTYRVLAKNSGGNSAWSSSISAVTDMFQSNTLIPDFEMKASAISMESTDRSPDKAIDGNISTMWIAADGNSNNWWEADLGQNYNFIGSKITFENNKNIWKYKIEVSKDNSSWTLVQDKTQNSSTAQVQEAAFSVTGRYVKVTITETPGTAWTAFSEFNLFGTKSDAPITPSVPTGLNAAAISDNEIDVSWNSADGATGYDIEVDGNVISNVTSPYVHTGLKAASAHTYRISAKNGSESSSWSAPVSAVTDAFQSSTLIQDSQIAATAVSSESSERGPYKAIDGDQSTMWVAADGNPNNWWEADLGENYDLLGNKIIFENDRNVWRYKVEVSKDNSNWTTVSDKTQNTSTDQIQESVYSITGRYIKVTFTQTPGTAWTAFKEFEVYGTKSFLPPVNKNNIMIIVPHEDDEALIASGIIERAVSQGVNVEVVLATNGDYLASDYSIGQKRLNESINAMNSLGVPTANIIALGYGDTGGLNGQASSYSEGFLYRLYNADSDTQIIQSSTGSTTYGIPEKLDDYHYKLTGTHGDYNRATFFSDLKTAINSYRPSDIYVTSLYDRHSDHAYLNLFVVDAIRSIKSIDSSYSPMMHEALVHYSDSDSNWPILDSDPAQIQPLSKPEDLDSTTLLDWNLRESISVPDDMLVVPRNSNRKYTAIQNYSSQFNNFISSFVKSDEVFWKKDFSNIAYNAVITASSENTEGNQYAKNVADGIAEGYPRFLTKEWATNGETAGAWIQLNWKQAQSVSKIVLYDRPNSVDNITSATLTFSDGSSIPVGQLPNDGKPLSITFSSKDISWVKLTVDAANGSNTGLSEFEVYK